MSSPLNLANLLYEARMLRALSSRRGVWGIAPSVPGAAVLLRRVIVQSGRLNEVRLVSRVVQLDSIHAKVKQSLLRLQVVSQC